MQTVHVIWRQDEDEFFVSRLDFDDDFDLGHLKPQQFVEMAWDTEHQITPPDERPPYIGTEGSSYELISIIKGGVEWIY